MTDDEQTFLAAIAAAPEDDGPRLRYADWLQENSTELTCRNCRGNGETHRPYPGGWDECDVCHGIGRVSDGRAERAEFIRVQCEIAKISIPGEPVETSWLNPEIDDLIGREATLLAAHEAEWLGLTVSNRGGPNWRRGFVEQITVPMMSEWCGGEPCQKCGGQGWHRDDSDFYRVVCNRCTNGRTPGMAAKVMRDHPGLVRVVPSDKRPFQSLQFPGYHRWFTESGVPYEAVNVFVYRLLNGHIRGKEPEPYWPTEAAAIDALATAMADWGRELAWPELEANNLTRCPCSFAHPPHDYCDGNPEAQL